MASNSRSDDRHADPDPANTVDNSDDLANMGRAAVAQAALQSGRDIPRIDDDTAAAYGQQIAGNQSTRDARRARIQQMQGLGIRGLYGPGRSHNGRRDYWRTFGYPDPRSVSPEDFEARVDTQDVADIVSNAPVIETWKHAPIIRDDGRNEDDDPTDFEKNVQRLFDGSTGGEDEGERLGINSYWKWVDREQRPVQFSVLVMGYSDGRDMSQPVNPNAIDGPDDLAYCNVYSQSDVTNWLVAGDFKPGDPILNGVRRQDKPILYEIKKKRSNPDGSITHKKKKIHYTRIHHVLEEPWKSEWLGRSCIQTLLHRLIDFEKSTGGPAEAQYTNVDRKLIALGNGDGSMTGDRTDMVEGWGEQVREMGDDMRKGAFLDNADVKELGGDTVDPSGMLDSLWPFASGVSGQPQRIMKGTERGDLASSQDESNWYSEIAKRQRQIAEPRIVRPTIDDWIRYGLVAEPEGGSYTVVWRPLFELTELEKAEKRHKDSQAMKNVWDTIAAGADEKATYREVGFSHPDDGGKEGSGHSGPDAAAGINESDAEIIEQFESMDRNTEGPSAIETQDEEGEKVEYHGRDEVDLTEAQMLMNAMKANADYDTTDTDEVYEKYEEITNMSSSALRGWRDTSVFEDYLDAQAEDNTGITIDRSIDLQEASKDEWGDDERNDAVKAISAIANHGEQADTENEVPGTDLTMTAATLRSLAYDPTEAYS